MAFLQRNNLPKTLAYISLVMLFVFIVFWNYKEFQNEKVELKKALSTQLQLANSEVKEANMISDIVMFMEEGESLDSLRSDTLKRSYFSFIDTISSNAEFRFVNMSSNSHNDTIPSRFQEDQLNFKTGFDSLVTGLDGKTRWTNASVDTTLIFDIGTTRTQKLVQKFSSRNPEREEKVYELYKQKISKNKLPTSFVIVDDKEDNEATDMRISYISNGFVKSTFTVETQHYRTYLLKKILSTLIFSLLLMGIVGLAFYSLLKGIAQQQRLGEIKNEFINNMTHELKTPISTIAVALEAIAGFGAANEPEKTEEYIQMSRKEVTKLSSLVDNVLKVAISDNSNQSYMMSNVDLAKLSQDAIDSLQLFIDQKDAEVNITIQASSTRIKVDKLHMSNTIINILDNALKYNEGKPIIRMSIKDDVKNIYMEIEDNGIGIAAENLKKIFQRFYRVPTDDKHDVKGHGLGMSYVSNVVKKHGGTITLQSVIGKGTTIKISLPKSMT